MEYIDDIRLCELAANAELTAIEMLYKRHYELMLNFGLKYSNDSDFVMDCIQDLFEKLICHPSLFSGVKYVRPWLLITLRNIIFNKLKTVKTHISLEELPFAGIDEDLFLISVSEQFSDEEMHRRQKVVDAFKRLNGNQRMAIYLHYFKGLSHKEVSVLLHMKEQSSMNLLSRALIKLRRHLSKLPLFSF